jgi:hypothetical protein
MSPVGVYPRTAEHKAKIGAAQRGRPRPQTTGEGNGYFAGDRVGYDGAHKRLSGRLPQECAFADETCRGRIESALRHETPPERLVGAVGRHHGAHFSLHEEDYMSLCQNHHIRYDKTLKWAT